jgi:hypothetical protein
MSASRKLLALSLCLTGWLACNGSSGPGGTGNSSGNAGTQGAAGSTSGGAGTGTAGTGNGGAGTTGAAGNGGSTGTAGQGGTGVAGNGGSTGIAGQGGTTGAAGSTGGAGTTGGGGSTGTAGTTGAAGTGGADACGTPPWRALKVTATAMLHTHGNYAALDGRAKSIGKIAVNLGVNGGGFATWLSKRGYHAMGTAGFTSCPAPDLGNGRDSPGNCRLNTEWKQIQADVTKNIKALAVSNPEEDWGYFLTQDGTNVRWSDVAFTGVSHGATTAAVIGRLGVCVWRVVSNAGPRDNTCGKGMCNPTQPELSYDPACPDAKIGSWLDMPSKTPIERFYGIDGISDVECGDILFNMERTKYPGKPVLFDSAGAVLTGTNRFISTNGGHLDFLNAANKPMNTDAVLNIAFAIPPENQNPAF